MQNFLSKNSKIYIQASNVHQGGGRSLLEALIDIVDFEVFLSVDSRMPLPINMAKNIHVRLVPPTILSRFVEERWIYKNVAVEDIILCFGNLPPLFKLKGYTVVFIQNRYLIDSISLYGLSLNTRIRIVIERLWLTYWKNHVDEFIVQTPTMKKLFEWRLKGRVPIHILPFISTPNVNLLTIPKLILKSKDVFDFVYVASGEPHKNHLKLIDAWCLLAYEGIFPSLCLTLDTALFSGLCELINERKRKCGLKVTNVGLISQYEVTKLYEKSIAMIYPSTFESFGIPLVEAMRAGMPVLASELDFVRDVLDPDQTFDPESPSSIARAVKRFMNVYDQPLPLLDASQFLASVFKRDNS